MLIRLNIKAHKNENQNMIGSKEEEIGLENIEVDLKNGKIDENN